MDNDGMMITNRFFVCIDLLKDTGRMEGGLKEFCDRHQINRSHLSYKRSNVEHTALKPEVIKWLCEDYDVNINYIMFNKGKILNK